MRRPFRLRRTGRGFALMALLALLVAGTLTFIVTAFGPEAMDAYRARKTEAALAQARDALLGYAMTYRDTQPGQVFGYLPCPDTDNDGDANNPCGDPDITVVGRLPWRTLGLPDLRDGYGECLWYVVSGHFKEEDKTDSLNWDTVSRIDLKDADGQTLIAGGNHGSPVAMILAPGPAFNAQDRTSAVASVCGGNNDVGAFLEGLTILPNAEVDGNDTTNSTVTLGTRASTLAGTHNDRGISISAKDIFDQVMKRSDFKSDIDTLLLDRLEACLNARSPLPLPDAAGSKGVDKVIDDCPAPPNTLSEQVQNNWKDNLLYAKAGTKFTINGDADCDGVIAFSGARETGEMRRDPTERAIAGNYLSDANATFPDSASGGTVFNPLLPSQDIFRCIKSPGPIILSFDNNIDDFQPAGTGLSIDKVSNPNHPRVEISPSGTRGGCLWYPESIPVKGRVWRVFYRSQFFLADPTSSPNAGYGFTFQLVNASLGMAPNTCGETMDMGALRLLPWGSPSIIFESDIHYSSDHNDPAGNHVAIMANGSLEHSTATNGNPTAACNGTAEGCVLAPPFTFEEPPTPLSHGHRIEIHTGCNSDCTNCDTPLGLHARMRAWMSCNASECTNLTSDLLTSPTVSRCAPVPEDIDQAYFGLTGGFNGLQGVTLWDFHLRAE